MNAQTAKITKVPCKVEVLGHTLRVTKALHDHDNDDIAVLGDCHEEEEQGNAALIAETFNVYHETGLTPYQLADQRAELLEALQKIPQRYLDDMDAHTPAASELIRAAIARATGEQP